MEAKSITSLVLYLFLCVCEMGVGKMGECEMGRIIVEMGKIEMEVGEMDQISNIQGVTLKGSTIYTSSYIYIYSKTCVKWPLFKKTENWFSRPIFA